MTLNELYNAIGADYDEAMKRLVSERLISKYIVKFPEDGSYNELMECWKNGEDTDRLFRAAHTLKGVCLNLALVDLFEIVNVITDHFREGTGKQVDNIDEYFDKMEAQYNMMIELIKDFANQQQ